MMVMVAVNLSGGADGPGNLWANVPHVGWQALSWNSDVQALAEEH